MFTVRAEVVGEGTRELTLDADATYGDLLAALEFSPHEAAVLVDGRPVPEDRAVDSDRVRVLRLVKGGAVDERAIRVRLADAADHLDVLRILDGAMLDTDAGRVRERIAAGAVLVATFEGGEPSGTARGDGDGGGRPVGALVRDGNRVTAVATRRRHRDRGVGSALVRAALDGRDRLVAEFDPDVRPFYASLGFDIEPIGDDRFRGRLDG